jgi:hypothetical protein
MTRRFVCLFAALAGWAAPAPAQIAPPDAKAIAGAPMTLGRTVLIEPSEAPAPSYEAVFQRPDGTLSILLHEHETTAAPSRVLALAVRPDGTLQSVRRLDIDLRKEEIDITRAGAYVLRDDFTAAYLETRDKATRLVEIAPDGTARTIPVPQAKPGYLLAATAAGYLAVIGDRDAPFHTEGAKFFLAGIGRDGSVAWRVEAPDGSRPLFATLPQPGGNFAMFWVRHPPRGARSDLAFAMLRVPSALGPPRLKRIGIEGAELILDTLLPFGGARDGAYLAARMTGSGHPYCAWLATNGAIRWDNDRKQAPDRRIECPGEAVVALGNGAVMGIDYEVETGLQSLLAVDRNGKRLWRTPPRPKDDRIDRLLLGAGGTLWLFGRALAEGGSVRALFAERLAWR